MVHKYCLVSQGALLFWHLTPNTGLSSQEKLLSPRERKGVRCQEWSTPSVIYVWLYLLLMLVVDAWFETEQITSWCHRINVKNQTLLWVWVHLVNISSPPEFTQIGQLMIEGQLVTYWLRFQTDTELQGVNQKLFSTLAHLVFFTQSPLSSAQLSTLLLHLHLDWSLR